MPLRRAGFLFFLLLGSRPKAEKKRKGKKKLGIGIARSQTLLPPPRGSDRSLPRYRYRSRSLPLLDLRPPTFAGGGRGAARSLLLFLVLSGLGSLNEGFIWVGGVGRRGESVRDRRSDQ